MAEAGGDHDKAVDLLADRLATIAADVRARVAVIPDAAETAMLVELADGLEARTRRLRSKPTHDRRD